MVIFLFIGMLFISGCAGIRSLPFLATATSYPTNTPYPTYTKFPTYTRVPTYTLVPPYTPLPPTTTPIPDTWTVKVISAEKSLTFGNFSFTANDKAEFIIVTIQYTYNGYISTAFWPMTVVLRDWFTLGYAMVPLYYQPEELNTVISFMNNNKLIAVNALEGVSRTERFGWALNPMGHTHFTLYFPETKPIDIVVDNIQ